MLGWTFLGKKKITEEVIFSSKLNPVDAEQLHLRAINALQRKKIFQQTYHFFLLHRIQPRVKTLLHLLHLFQTSTTAKKSFELNLVYSSEAVVVVVDVAVDAVDADADAVVDVSA